MVATSRSAQRGAAGAISRSSGAGLRLPMDTHDGMNHTPAQGAATPETPQASTRTSTSFPLRSAFFLPGAAALCGLA